MGERILFLKHGKTYAKMEEHLLKMVKFNNVELNKICLRLFFIWILILKLEYVDSEDTNQPLLFYTSMDFPMSYKSLNINL